MPKEKISNIKVLMTPLRIANTIVKTYNGRMVSKDIFRVQLGDESYHVDISNKELVKIDGPNCNYIIRKLGASGASVNFEGLMWRLMGKIFPTSIAFNMAGRPNADIRKVLEAQGVSDPDSQASKFWDTYKDFTNPKVMATVNRIIDTLQDDFQNQKLIEEFPQLKGKNL